jgi:hypothetical protein
VFAAGAIWQLPKIKKQLTLATQANVSEAYAVVSERSASLRNVLAADKAALYPYFYDGIDPDQTRWLSKRPWLRKRPNKDALDLACEAFVDFADVCVEQRKTIAGADMDWSTWDSYFRYVYQHSPVLQRFLRKNIDFYPDYVTTVFGYIVVRDEKTGVVKSQWEVHESNEESKGYPWGRTWLISEITPKKKRPMLKAAVKQLNPETVDVWFTWEQKNEQNVQKKTTEQVLYSWVLSQLKSSSRLRTANIVVDAEDPKPRSRSPLGAIARMRRGWILVTRRLPRERLLAPEVRFRSAWTDRPRNRLLLQRPRAPRNG